MPVLSDTFVVVTLPSGNKAAYGVTPQQIERWGNELRTEQIRQYGRARAHRYDGQWYEAGSWIRIEDPHTLALLDRLPEIDD